MPSHIDLGTTYRLTLTNDRTSQQTPPRTLSKLQQVSLFKRQSLAVTLARKTISLYSGIEGIAFREFKLFLKQTHF